MHSPPLANGLGRKEGVGCDPRLTEALRPRLMSTQSNPEGLALSAPSAKPLGGFPQAMWLLQTIDCTNQDNESRYDDE